MPGCGTGAGLSGAGLIALVYAVIEAPSEGWTSTPVVAGALVALVLLGAFVRRQRRIAEPLLDLALFRNPRFSAASSAVGVLFFALFGFLFLSTQYLQFVLGFSPSEAGVRVLPYAGAMIVGADNLSLETFPSEVEGNYVPVHTYLLAQHGVPILELVDLVVGGRPRLEQ